MSGHQNCPTPIAVLKGFVLLLIQKLGRIAPKTRAVVSQRKRIYRWAGWFGLCRSYSFVSLPSRRSSRGEVVRKDPFLESAIYSLLIFIVTCSQCVLRILVFLHLDLCQSVTLIGAETRFILLFIYRYTFLFCFKMWKICWRYLLQEVWFIYNSEF